MELASWFAVLRNQLMDSQTARRGSRVKADEVEPVGGALMLLADVLSVMVNSNDTSAIGDPRAISVIDAMNRFG